MAKDLPTSDLTPQPLLTEEEFLALEEAIRSMKPKMLVPGLTARFLYLTDTHEQLVVVDHREIVAATSRYRFDIGPDGQRVFVPYATQLTLRNRRRVVVKEPVDQISTLIERHGS